MADEILRRLQRQLSQSEEDDELWFKVQARRRLIGLPYQEARVSEVEDHMDSFREEDPEHGDKGLITYLNNGWHVETWWDDNEWGDHGDYPGYPIGWTTITYDEDNFDVARAIHCMQLECAITCHQKRVNAIIDGTIHYE